MRRTSPLTWNGSTRDLQSNARTTTNPEQPLNAAAAARIGVREPEYRRNVSRRTLLFLGASVSQLAAIKHARALGYRVVAVDGDPDAIAFRHADVAEVVDFTDVERVIEIGARRRVDGVLAISTDRAVGPAAAVAEALGLPGIGVDVARGFTNKSEMRRRLASAGIAQPRSRVVTSAADVAAAFAGFTPPVVLKPADSGGQRGLFLVDTADDVELHLAETLAHSRSGQAMLEEHLVGIELNCLLVVRNGEATVLTLSDRLRPGGLGFGVGWIHVFPSVLPAATLEEAEALAVSAVTALSLHDGIAFPQLIATADGVRVIEAAARIAAGQMADLVSYGTGVNLFEIAFAQAVGDDVPDRLVTRRFTRPLAIRFLTASPGVLPVGTITSIGGLDRVRSAPGVLAADLYIGPGATVRPVQVDADRSGYVIATAGDALEALELADRASELLLVQVEEQAPPVSRWRRRSLAIPMLAGAVLAACAIVVISTMGPPLRPSLVGGSRVSKELSPACHCPRDVARIAFRLLRAEPLTFRIVNASGHTVATLVHSRLLAPGEEQFAWRGRNARGAVLPYGDYRPEVVFDTLHRTLVLPGSIDLVG
jgi:biotin carboxylase